jgi:hypothetical protein
MFGGELEVTCACHMQGPMITEHSVNALSRVVRGYSKC